MRNFLKVAGLGAMMLGASLASAQVTKQGSGYLFRLHLTKGQQLHYNAPVTIEGLLPKQPVKLGLKLDVKVLEVKNQMAKIQGHLNAGKYKGAQIMPSRTVAFKVDSRGRVTDATGSLGGFTVVFPKYPVKLGNSFVAPVPVLLNSASEQSEVGSRDATFTFVGFYGKGEKRAAKLVFIVAGNLAPSGAILVSVKDGTMQKYATKFYLNTSAAKPLVVTASFNRI